MNQQIFLHQCYTTTKTVSYVNISAQGGIPGSGFGENSKDVTQEMRETLGFHL